MKKLKVLSILCAVFFISCTSDSDSDTGRTTPIEVKVSGTIDFNALASLSGDDATALVTFDGQPALGFTTEAIPGDKITYTIDNLPAGKTVFYEEFRLVSGSTQLWASMIPIHDGAGMIIGLEAPSSTIVDEFKFDILFTVVTNGVKDPKIFRIDPKIKLKAKK